MVGEVPTPTRQVTTSLHRGPGLILMYNFPSPSSRVNSHRERDVTPIHWTSSWYNLPILGCIVVLETSQLPQTAAFPEYKVLHVLLSLPLSSQRTISYQSACRCLNLILMVWRSSRPLESPARLKLYRYSQTQALLKKLFNCLCHLQVLHQGHFLRKNFCLCTISSYISWPLTLVSYPREVIRAPIAEFFGLVIFVWIGAGSDCQAVLSTSTKVASSPKGVRPFNSHVAALQHYPCRHGCLWLLAGLLASTLVIGKHWN